MPSTSTKATACLSDLNAFFLTFLVVVGAAAAREAAPAGDGVTVIALPSCDSAASTTVAVVASEASLPSAIAAAFLLVLFEGVGLFAMLFVKGSVEEGLAASRR